MRYGRVVMAADELSTAEATDETPPGAPNTANTPTFTWPQRLAFLAFLIFVIMAIIADGTNKKALVQPDELSELRKFALFLIAALLPSDALIRFGRNLLFRTIKTAQEDDPNLLTAEQAAAIPPATTDAQTLAFGTFLVLAGLTLLSNKLVSADEFAQANEVARTLVIALLPSEAVLRFGRSMYYASPATPAANTTAFKRV